MGKLSRYGFVDRMNPEASARCDGAGEIVKHSDLKKQMRWSGSRLVWTGMMKCSRHLDHPQEQDRLLVLAANPIAVMNARPDLDSETTLSDFTADFSSDFGSKLVSKTTLSDFTADFSSDFGSSLVSETTLSDFTADFSSDFGSN